jgi:uncharacterized protein
MPPMTALLRWIACLFLALVSSLSFAAWAQAPEVGAPEVSAPVPTEPARPALWKVADRDTKIWLFGTIHALPPGIGWFDGPVREAFDGSDELVTEIAGIDPLAVQRMVLERAILPEGMSLRAMLGDDLKASYEKQLGDMNLPVQTFDGFKPWYAALNLSTLSNFRQGYAKVNGVEHALTDRAKTLGLSHGALETAEFQIDLFDSLPLDTQKRYLADMIEELPSAGEQLATMIEAWRNGDAVELAKMLNSEDDDPLLAEMLLTARNKAWADWIGNRLDRPGTVFLAVGAGHLAGDDSVQELLTARGLTVHRVQ